MSDLAVSFLAQPIQSMAGRGEGFSDLVIDTLRRWVSSSYVETVRDQYHDRIFALSADPADPWRILVIRRSPDLAEPRACVCGIEFVAGRDAIEHFLPLLDVEHIQPAMQVRLDKIEAKMFAALAVRHAHDFSEPIPEKAPKAPRTAVGFDVASRVDAVGRRWASSQARTHFKEVFDRARKQPQIVERGDDDLVVMSRTYLKELIEPSSARAMARHYRVHGIHGDGLVELEALVVNDLEELPELGSK